ncbi:ribokinase [Cohnella sp. GCM10012308]|uniref:ribokinase n=1 Tax=Cohnella sp. GCM10012308 TaxID=3317329 RepID=UPI00361B83BA
MSKKPVIAVVGSFNMDMVVSLDRLPRLGETIAGERIQYAPGGKGANQAVGCARLGAATVMIGALGNDRFGREIADSLAQEAIDMEGAAFMEDFPTGVASILRTQEDNCIVVVPGANERCTPDWIDEHAERIRQSGLLLVQLEIPLESVIRAMEIAREAGVKIVLNPAPARPLPEYVLRLADYLTPNETEFEALSGTDIESEEMLFQAMSSWQRRYGHTLVVTRGEKGIAAADKDGIRTIKAPSVKVVDTTGAGDALNAALGYGIANGWPIGDSASFAVRAAALSVTRFGAQHGMPYRDEVTIL